jgi:hypothetical protein
MCQKAIRGLLAAVLAGGVAAAQAPARRATNLAAIRAYPGYFHLRQVLVSGTLRALNGNLYLSSEGLTLPVLVDSGQLPDGDVDVRGEVWDIGRMQPEDPRLARNDVLGRLRVDPNAAWPRAGEVVAILASSVEAASRPSGPSIRGLVLDPARFLDQTVTVTGQFSGRNLLGDLPDAPGRSRWDFVLRSADAAVWVSGAQPKGRDFNLSLDQRRDTEQWLRVTGTLKEAGGIQWIESREEQIALASEPEAPSEAPDTAIRVPAAPPPEVLFSAPTGGEIDVPVDTTVRIQFSRDIDPKTIEGHVTAAYRGAGVPGAPPGPAAPTFKTAYRPGNRVLEITFDQPLERFRTLVVTLDAGMLGTDGQPLKPWSVTFDLGG